PPGPRRPLRGRRGRSGATHAAGAARSPAWRRASSAPHDAELVALGVGEDDEDILRVRAHPQPACPERLDANSGGLLVGGPEVDVHAVLHDLGLGDLLEPEARAPAG